MLQTAIGLGAAALLGLIVVRFTVGMALKVVKVIVTLLVVAFLVVVVFAVFG